MSTFWIIISILGYLIWVASATYYAAYSGVLVDDKGDIEGLTCFIIGVPPIGLLLLLAGLILIIPAQLGAEHKKNPPWKKTDKSDKETLLRGSK